MSNFGILFDSDINMYCECNFGPVITWYTSLVVVTFMIMCLMTSAAYEDDSVDGPTYFIPQPTNVTFSVGQTATLQCSVENLGDKFVVWRKRSEPHPISVGELIYSPDKRFDVSISKERRQYDLLVRNVQSYDAGVYECQVSSRNKIIRYIMLKVNAKRMDEPLRPHLTNQNSQISPTPIPPYIMPEITLKGREFVNSGESIRLVCNISGITDVPQDLDWFKNGNLLRPYQSKKITIHKDSSIAKRKLNSVLEIKNSKLEDSGTYVCRNSERLIASQKVIVLNEEKSKNGKRGTAADAKSGQICNKQWWTLFLATFLTNVITKGFLYLS